MLNEFFSPHNTISLMKLGFIKESEITLQYYIVICVLFLFSLSDM